jgi:hypothetical protein
VADANLALRVVAQVDQAVAGMRRLTEQTAAADKQAAQTGGTFSTLASRVRGALGIGGGGGGGAGLGSLVGAAAGGFLGSMAGNIFDQLSSVISDAQNRALQKAQQNLDQPTSGPDIVNQLNTIRKRTGSFWGNVGKIFTDPRGDITRAADLFTGQAGWSGFQGDAARAEAQAWRAYVQQHPDWAAAALATGQLPSGYGDIYRQIVQRQQASAGFQATHQGATINIYGALDATSTGRQVAAAVDYRDRNNGMYQTTFTRRG